MKVRNNRLNVQIIENNYGKNLLEQMQRDNGKYGRLYQYKSVCKKHELNVSTRVVNASYNDI